MQDSPCNPETKLLTISLPGYERRPLQAWRFVQFLQNEGIKYTIILLNEAYLNYFTTYIRRTKILEGGGVFDGNSSSFSGVKVDQLTRPLLNKYPQEFLPQ